MFLRGCESLAVVARSVLLLKNEKSGGIPLFIQSDSKIFYPIRNISCLSLSILCCTI